MWLRGFAPQASSRIMLKLCCNGLRDTLSPNRTKCALQFYTSSSSATRRGAAGRCLTIEDYLMKTLGYSKGEAISVSTKVSRLNSAQEADSVIYFLRTNGLDEAHIKKLILSLPRLLNCNLHKTLIPKFKFFRGIGMSGNDVALVFSRNPLVLQKGLESYISPTIDWLKMILGSTENVAKVLRKSSLLLSGTSVRTREKMLELLRSYGLSDERIRRLVLLHPVCLRLSEKKLEDSLFRAENVLQIPRQSACFIHGVRVMCALTEKNYQSKYETFVRHGWKESEVINLARGQPTIMTLSEATISSKLNFFMNELGYSSEYLASRPSLLGYSMEKRIVPRMAVLQALKDGGLIREFPHLKSVFGVPDSKFFNSFLLPHKDAVPHLMDLYVN